MKTLVALLVLSAPLIDAHAKGIPDNETPSVLFEGQREVTSLTEVNRLGLNEGRTSLDLWSGSYWPHYQGSLGIRYRDPSFIALMEGKAQWDKFKELVEATPLYSYSGKENLLSPAEKYDLLVGDTEMTLTRYSWELGEKAISLTGKVPAWRGICDGWASASQMMPRPVKAVTLTTRDGLPVTFYPEDIKALGSLLYARAQENVIFLGKRCHSRALGLFTDACDGTNPGTLHRALINRVGKMKKSFIADVSPGSEVWNYPVKNYKFIYYNVFTHEESSDFRKVMERFEKKNRFAKSMRRHEKTYAIVGVKAVVEFADMREQNLFETDGSSMDKTLEKTYLYDLELDQNFNVIGGESMSKNLPDFIWAANDGAYPMTFVEKTKRLSTTEEIAAASRLTTKRGQPLTMIVKRLFEAAKL